MESLTGNEEANSDFHNIFLSFTSKSITIENVDLSASHFSIPFHEEVQLLFAYHYFQEVMHKRVECDYIWGTTNFIHI